MSANDSAPEPLGRSYVRDSSNPPEPLFNHICIEASEDRGVVQCNTRSEASIYDPLFGHYAYNQHTRKTVTIDIYKGARMWVCEITHLPRIA